MSIDYLSGSIYATLDLEELKYRLLSLMGFYDGSQPTHCLWDIGFHVCSGVPFLSYASVVWDIGCKLVLKYGKW